MRDHHLAARRDDIFDHGDSLAADVGALGELRGAVGLGLLAHERCRYARLQRQRGGDRYAAQLQPGQHLGVGWQQRHERGGDVGEQNRVGLEPVLVEVLGGDLAGTKRECAGQPSDRVDPLGECIKRHDRQSVDRDGPRINTSWATVATCMPSAANTCPIARPRPPTKLWQLKS